MIKLRPKELTDIKYWMHLVVIAVIVLGVLQYLYGGEMFTLSNVVKSVPLLAVGDISAHSLLQID